MNTSLDTRAADIIRSHTVLAAAGAAIPIPVVDLLALGAIQNDMLGQLARIYDVEVDPGFGKQLLKRLTGLKAAKYGASAAKLFAGLGTVVGGGVQAGLGGASTYAVGQVLRDTFARGGDLRDLRADMAGARRSYERYLWEGKEVARTLREKQQRQQAAAPVAARAPRSDGLLDALERLGRLKEAGHLTDEEFVEHKRKIFEHWEGGASEQPEER